jgi:hypothetical protein
MRSLSISVFSLFLIASIPGFFTGEKKDNMSSWTRLPGSDGKDITVTEKGEFYLVNTAGKLYKYNGTKWEEKQIYNGRVKIHGYNMGKQAWYLGESGLIWTMKKKSSAGYWYDTEENLFPKGNTGIKDLAIDSTGTLFTVESNGRLYVYKWGWSQLGGSDGSRISAGAEVWLVNTVGKIYKFTGNRNFRVGPSPDQGWKQMPGAAGRDIAVANDGSVWMVNQAGTIFQWNDNGWIKLDGSDGYRIAANAGKVVLINTEGEIYTRNY